MNLEKRKAYAIAGEILAILEDTLIDFDSTNMCVSLEIVTAFSGGVVFRMHCIDMLYTPVTHMVSNLELISSRLTVYQWAAVVHDELMKKVQVLKHPYA